MSELDLFVQKFHKNFMKGLSAIVIVVYLSWLAWLLLTVQSGILFLLTIVSSSIILMTVFGYFETISGRMRILGWAVNAFVWKTKPNALYKASSTSKNLDSVTVVYADLGQYCNFLIQNDFGTLSNNGYIKLTISATKRKIYFTGVRNLIPAGLRTKFFNCNDWRRIGVTHVSSVWFFNKKKVEDMCINDVFFPMPETD